MVEEHGKKFVKITAMKTDTGKGKGKGKSSSAVASVTNGKSKQTGLTVTVTKVPPKLIPLPFLDDPPSEGTRGAQERKKDDGGKGNE